VFHAVKVTFLGELSLFQFSFRNVWRLVKIIALIQILNVAIGLLMWLSYGYLVSVSTIVTSSVGYKLLILAIKTASESAAKVEPNQCS
jgi:hypothetical protein